MRCSPNIGQSQPEKYGVQLAPNTLFGGDDQNFVLDRRVGVVHSEDEDCASPQRRRSTMTMIIMHSI